MKKENENVKSVEELLTLIPKDKLEEVVKMASKAQTAEEIRAIADEYNVELSDEQLERRSPVERPSGRT